MSVKKNPIISELNPESLCFSIYKHLYNTFFNSQDKKDAEHPWGVTEGDETSIRLHNTAYGFADAISLGIDNNGFVGNGTLLEYLKKQGGDMSGMFRSNYGFEAGLDNDRILWTYKDETKNIKGVRVNGILDLGAESLYIGGKRFISYEKDSDTLIVKNNRIDFKSSNLFSIGELIFGDKNNGLVLNSGGITLNGFGIYHTGNANILSVDWKMKNASVGGNLTVMGSTLINGKLKACTGVELGANGKTLLSLAGESVNLTGFLSFANSFGIRIENISVLIRTNKSDIQVGAVGGDFLLGSENTSKIRLQSHITTDDGEHTLITKYGGAYFPDSFIARHNYGDVLLSTFRKDSSNEGIIVHKRLRFNDNEDIYLYGNTDGIGFCSYYSYTDTSTSQKVTLTFNTVSRYLESTSLFRPLNKKSVSLQLSTEADFIVSNKPFESKGHIGIDNSKTRLTDNSLFFNENNLLVSVKAGIKHYGNALFLSDISSEFYSSGFAGSGWAILNNKSTGNVSATFDELTIRKKMRIYELEVQKISTTNGSLWISDNCSGDIVIKL